MLGMEYLKSAPCFHYIKSEQVKVSITSWKKLVNLVPDGRNISHIVKLTGYEPFIFCVTTPFMFVIGPEILTLDGKK